MQQFLQFPDKCVTYATFVHDVAATVVAMMKQSKDDPETVSQRRAYAMFGRGNVDRWRKKGEIEPYVRPGKIEYRTAELRRLQSMKQDYFK